LARRPLGKYDGLPSSSTVKWGESTIDQTRTLREAHFIVMSIALVLLVSADPSTIRQFSHALQGLSLSPDVCQEVPAAIRLLQRRKFDAVIVDLQLGEQSGRMLDAIHRSPSNRTAVRFAIGSNDA